MLKKFLGAFVKGSVSLSQLKEVRDIINAPVKGEAARFVDHMCDVFSLLPKLSDIEKDNDSKSKKCEATGSQPSRKKMCEPLLDSLEEMKKQTTESFVSRHL